MNPALIFKTQVYDIKHRLSKDNTNITRLVLESYDLDITTLNYLNSIWLSNYNKNRDININISINIK